MNADLDNPQSRFATDKTVVVARVEGTLRDRETGAPIADAVAALELLREGGAYVVLASPAVYTELGLSELYDWVATNNIPYDDVWASYGVPPADQWYDNEALTL